MSATKSPLPVLSDLIDRGDDALTCRAVEWLALDLAALWPDLDDAQRDALVASGAVAEVEAAVELTDAESWQSDWRSENGASWPAYTLEVSAAGMPVALELTGWHCVGYHSPDYSHNSHWWGELDNDGPFHGTPRIGDDEWKIESGSNVGTSHAIPCWRDAAGRWVTLDRAALNAELDRVAGTADHGAEPSWEDVTAADRVEWDDETLWLIRDGALVEETIWHGGIARCESRDDESDTYGAEAWGVRGTGNVYETRAEAVAALAESADDGATHAEEAAGEAALAARVESECETVPDGFGLRLLAGVLSVVPDDADQEERPLSREELEHVTRHGWAGVLYAAGLIEGPGVYDAPDGRHYDDGATVVRFAADWRGLHVSAGVMAASDANRIGIALRDLIVATRATAVGHADLVLADAVQDTGYEGSEAVAQIIRAAVAAEQEK